MAQKSLRNPKSDQISARSQLESGSFPWSFTLCWGPLYFRVQRLIQQTKFGNISGRCWWSDSCAVIPFFDADLDCPENASYIYSKEISGGTWRPMDIFYHTRPFFTLIKSTVFILLLKKRTFVPFQIITWVSDITELLESSTSFVMADLDVLCWYMDRLMQCVQIKDMCNFLPWLIGVPLMTIWLHWFDILCRISWVFWVFI